MQAPLTRQFPRSIQRILQKSQLGSPQAVFVARPMGASSLLPGQLCGLFGLLLFGVFAYLYTNTSLLSSWPLWQIILIPLIALAWCIIGGWLILSARKARGSIVIVCANGLLYQRGTSATMRWDEIDALWQAIESNQEGDIAHFYTIRAANGVLWTFTEELADLQKLGAAIENEVTRRLAPRFFATYRAGQPVNFDSITITQQGVQLREGERHLPWSDIQHVHIDHTAVSIYKHGEFWDWATIPTSTVANVAILKQFVEQILAERNHNPLADMLARYHAGHLLTFGQLHLSTNGIALPEYHLFIPWNDVATIGVGEQEIIIKRSSPTSSIDGWHTIPLRQVSNVTLLKSLLNTIIAAINTESAEDASNSK